MPDNAAIYISDPSLIGTRLFDKISAIRSAKDKSSGDSATGLVIDVGTAVIDMNFMPSSEVSAHLNGFMGYAQHLLGDNRDDLLYAVSRISAVRFVIGCVIDPGFDEANTVFEFLQEFTGRLNGLLFLRNSIVDFDGRVLAGPLRTNPP